MSTCVCGPIRHMLGNQHDSRCPLYPAPFVPPMTVTVVDQIPYSASVSPEQAAAYCRRKLPGWQEVQHDRGPDREPWIIMFTAPDGPPLRQVMVPNDATFGDYSRR